MILKSTKIKRWLEKNEGIIFSLYAMTAAFCTYSCMYAFRKPFAVATFEGMQFFHIDYKILLITSQVLGYTLSKFLGIKIISEQKNKNRPVYILLFTILAEVALLLFAIVPPPYNIIFLFINGLPLGMVWGVVFSYLEGRKTTELLGAGLCVSFIFSSGFVKSAGKFLMLELNISEFWMPFFTGLIFIIPLLIFVWLLDQIPDPSMEDREARTERKPMSGTERMRLVQEYGIGLILLIFAYMILTTFRDFRDNFAAEIWDSLGYGSSSEIFTLTEIPISIAILILMGLMIFIKNNIHAFMINHLIIIFGFFIIGTGTFFFEANLVNPVIWVSLVGFGLYAGYVPFNSILFERMIAAFKSSANVGFLIYLADSFGYLGSVGIMFYKNFSYPNLDWLTFFKSGSIVISIIGLLLTFSSMIYFHRKYRYKNSFVSKNEMDIAVANNL